MSNVGTRIVVSALGIPAIVVLAYMGPWAVALPLAVVAALGAAEYHGFVARGEVRPFGLLGGIGAAALVLGGAWQPTLAGFAPVALAITGLGVLGSMGFVLTSHTAEERPLESAAATVFGMLYVGLPLAFAPILLRLPFEQGWAGEIGGEGAGLAVIALPLTATWAGDSAAFFVGSRWGKRRLAPTISPNKSWEGFWANIVGAAGSVLVWQVIAQPSLPGLPLSMPVTALCGAVLGLGAVAGDLVESLFKRQAGVKDSGRFLPGHGGVLDRLDSIVVTLPIGYVLFTILARI